MVELMKSGNFLVESEGMSCGGKAPVKIEIEDSLEDEFGPLNKRSKPALQEVAGNDAFAMPPSQYNPLDEPSPLGLRLRKSPSLLELIQMKLSQGGSTEEAPTDNLKSVDEKESRGTGTTSTTEKLKASNFPASLLKIGSWEYKSRYEGDLVAKCYFAKHKLVWEVLEAGLKSKIEIQWSDITALTAHCPDTEPGTLRVVLARQPLFYKETNPQPRKHTLWQATADFTDGQASVHRQHLLQCSPGLLNKHFEKLIQCDMRLNFLSRQPEMVLENPYFAQRVAFEDLEQSERRLFEPNDKESKITGLMDVASPSTQSSSFKIGQQDSGGMVLEHRSQEVSSSSSVVDTRGTEGGGRSEVVDSRSSRNWDEINVPGLHPSMSVSELLNHLGHCISEQMTSGNPTLTEQASEHQHILDEIAQCLLGDNQSTAASDEKSLMTRVNSLCCLLQKDPSVLQSSQADGNDKPYDSPECSDEGEKTRAAPGEGKTEVSPMKQTPPPAMSRKDSFGDLLFHLPRIASLPKFLFDLSEADKGCQNR